MGLSNLGQKLARIGRDTKNGVQKMSDSVTIKNRISAEKRSLERLFAVIGESVYKEKPDAPKEGLEDEYAAVKVAYANIEKYSRQLDKVNGIVYCPNCGQPADPGDKFCAKCGAKLTQEETASAKVAEDFREVGQEMGRIAGNAAGKTGEFFGSAAAKTRNGFFSLKDKSARFMKDASRKMKRDRDEETPQDAEPGEATASAEGFTAAKPRESAESAETEKPAEKPDLEVTETEKPAAERDNAEETEGD